MATRGVSVIPGRTNDHRILGDGLKRQSKWIDGMVVRVRSADALWQCLDVLDNGSPMFPDLMDFILMRILQKFGPFGCVSSIQN